MTIRHCRTRTTLWALVILTSMALTAAGLILTVSLIRTPETYAREGPGHALIFAGALASAAAAIWARLRGQGWPVTLAVAGPALLVGWSDLAMPESLLPHLGALVGVPAAFAGLLAGVLGRHHGSPGDAWRPAGGPE